MYVIILGSEIRNKSTRQFKIVPSKGCSKFNLCTFQGLSSKNGLVIAVGLLKFGMTGAAEGVVGMTITYRVDGFCGELSDWMRIIIDEPGLSLDLQMASGGQH